METTETLAPVAPLSNPARFNRGHAGTGVREKQYGKQHDVFDGAPCEWSRERGATHTLWCGDGPGRGTRPAGITRLEAAAA